MFTKRIFHSTELTHKPTGIIVSCKEERTQKDNEAMALRILKAKIYKNNDRESETVQDNYLLVK